VCAPLKLRIAQRTNRLVFEPRRNTVRRYRNSRYEAPRIDREWFSGGSGRCAAGTDTNRAGKCRTAAKEGSSIQQAVAGHWLDEMIASRF
jgi:hypothetical protein